MDPCARPWTMAGMGPSRIKSLTKFGIWQIYLQVFTSQPRGPEAGSEAPSESTARTEISLLDAQMGLTLPRILMYGTRGRPITK